MIESSEKLPAELVAVKQLVDSVEQIATTANTNALAALAKTSKMLVGADSTQKNQKITLSTLFGLSDDSSIKARSTTFLVGAKGFLGYVNDADGTTYIDKEVTEDPAGLAQYEVVNYRTLIKQIRNFTSNLPNTYLKREGDAATDTAVHTFSTVIFRGDGRKVYYKTTSKDAQDVSHEIVNRDILTTTIKQALIPYISNDGGTYIQLSVETAPQNPTDVVRLADLANFLTTDGGTVNALKVTKTPVDDTDVVRFTDLKNYTYPTVTLPDWTSGKFAFGIDATNPDALASVSKYSIRQINIANQINGAYYAKILSLSNPVSLDNSDIGFKNFSTLKQRQLIPGNSLPGAESRLPYPTDYTLYLEADIDATEMSSLFDLTAGTRMRIPIASSIFDQTQHFIYSLGIDKDGDLAVLFRSSGFVNVPWRSEPISIQALEKCRPRLYVKVNSWSYYSPALKYVTSNYLKAGPSLTDHTFVKKQSDPDVNAGIVTKSFRLYAVDVLNPVWQINASTGGAPRVKTDLETGIWYCEVDFPNVFSNTTEEIITVSLTVSGTKPDQTVYISPITSVNVRLEKNPIPTDGLTLLNNDITVLARQLHAPYLISFNPMASGGTKPYTFSVDQASSTVSNLSYDSRLNLITGTHAGTGQETVTLTVTDAHGLTCTKQIPVYIDQSTASPNCFGEDTYVLTPNGGVKYKDLSKKDKIISPRDVDHAVGCYKLTVAPIDEIKVVENAPTVTFCSIVVKPDHRFGLWNGTWRALSQLKEDKDSIIAIRAGSAEAYHFNGLSESHYTGKLYNLSNSNKTYLVSASKRGPWFIVHNEKIAL